MLDANLLAEEMSLLDEPIEEMSLLYHPLDQADN